MEVGALSIIGHIHFPHLPQGDPWHRHEINKNMRGGGGKRGGFGSMNNTELRIALGILAVFAIGVLFVVVT